MLTLYQYPKCGTCRKAIKYLKDKEIKFESIDLSKETPCFEKLKKLYKTDKYPLKKFFNTSGLIYRELKLKDKLNEMSDDEAFKLLSKEGMLIKRPLLIKNNDFLIGFKEEEWSEFIKR